MINKCCIIFLKIEEIEWIKRGHNPHLKGYKQYLPGEVSVPIRCNIDLKIESSYKTYLGQKIGPATHSSFDRGQKSNIHIAQEGNVLTSEGSMLGHK